MMLSTNNSLEYPVTTYFKRDYTGRKRLSSTKDKRNDGRSIQESNENKARISNVTKATKKSAEKLLKTLDKLILFKAEKSLDRPTVKEEEGIVRGKLKAVGVFLRQGYNISTREAFAEEYKSVIRRRQSLDYLDFDQFMSDLSRVAIMEVIQFKSGKRSCSVMLFLKVSKRK